MQPLFASFSASWVSRRHLDEVRAAVEAVDDDHLALRGLASVAELGPVDPPLRRVVQVRPLDGDRVVVAKGAVELVVFAVEHVDVFDEVLEVAGVERVADGYLAEGELLPGEYSVLLLVLEARLHRESRTVQFRHLSLRIYLWSPRSR